MSNICRWALCTEQAESGNVYCRSHPPPDFSPTVTRYEINENPEPNNEWNNNWDSEPEEAPSDNSDEGSGDSYR